MLNETKLNILKQHEDGHWRFYDMEGSSEDYFELVEEGYLEYRRTQPPCHRITFKGYEALEASEPDEPLGVWLTGMPVPVDGAAIGDPNIDAATLTTLQALARASNKIAGLDDEGKPRKTAQDEQIVEREKQRLEKERHRLFRFAQRDFRERGRGAVVSHWLNGALRFCEYRTRDELVEMLKVVNLTDEHLLPMVDTYNPETGFVVFIFVVRHTTAETANGDNAVCLRRTGIISMEEILQ